MTMEQARERFRAYMIDANALIAFGVQARMALADGMTPTRAWRRLRMAFVDQTTPMPWFRLSDLIFSATLDTDEETLSKIARALDMSPPDFLGLRTGQVDPLCCLSHSMAMLWQLLDTDEAEFKRLVMADSARFNGQLRGALAVRGARPTTDETWGEIVRAHERLLLSAPTRTEPATPHTEG